MLLLAIFAIYWVLISVIAIKMNLNTFKKLASYRDLRQQKPQWQGIMRTDFSKWQKNKILIGSFTILPIRFFALANFLVGALCFAFFIGLFKEPKIKQRIVKACIWYFNNYGKLMNNISLRITDNCPTAKDCKIKSPIIISNHNCWFDTFYITLKYSPVSFVAKYDIQFWPVIGPLSKAINCIFVKRQSEKDRNSVKDAIQKRIEDFHNGIPDAFPLVIYPEGTTSNNRVILNFKNGAFQNLSPVTMFCFKYQCSNCLLGQDEIQQSEHIFIMLSQLNSLHVTKLQVAPEQGQSADQYRQRCRNLMASTLGFPLADLGYRDRLQLQKLRKQQKNR